jgi:hypothetical protein
MFQWIPRWFLKPPGQSDTEQEEEMDDSFYETSIGYPFIIEDEKGIIADEATSVATPTRKLPQIRSSLKSFMLVTLRSIFQEQGGIHARDHSEQSKDSSQTLEEVARGEWLTKSLQDT